MALFIQRSDPVRLMKRRLVIAVLLLFLAAAVRGIWDVYQKLQESQTLRHEAEVQLENLKMRETSLRTDISKLKSDRGMEEVLREEYELARDGEGVVVIVEPQAPPPELQPSTFQRFKTWFNW